MAAPTIRPSVVAPASLQAHRPYKFDLGLAKVRAIFAGASDLFEWVNSTGNSNEWYVRKRTGGGNPWPDITSNPILNVRARARVTFTAFDTSNTIDAADQSKSGVTTSGVTITPTGTIADTANYRFTADMTRTAGNVTVNIIDGNGTVVATQTRTSNGAFSIQIQSGPNVPLTVQLIKVTSGTADFTNISLVQETFSYNTRPTLSLRPGTPGSLPRYGVGWGDNDSLGYDTLYVRFYSNEQPGEQEVIMCWDETDIGNAEPWKYHSEFWFKSTSTGLATWPDRYRKVVDYRLQGTDREGELVDLAGREPDSTRGSPIVCNTWIGILTEGTWIPCWKVWNSDGDSTVHEGSPITVVADTRSEVTVLHSGGADYTTIQAAVTATAGTPHKIRILNGHNETITTGIQIDTNETLLYVAEGESALIRNRTVTGSGGNTPFTIRSSYTWIMGLDGQPINNLDTENPSANFCTIASSSAAATPSGVDNVVLLGCRILKDTTVGNDRGLYSSLIFTNSFTSGTYVQDRYVRGMAVINCSAPDGQDDYFYNSQNSVFFDDDIFIAGCFTPFSRQESGLRTTNDNYNYNVIFSDIRETSKDAIRTTIGTGHCIANNFIDGACRIASSSSGVSIPTDSIWTGNRFRRSTTASGLASMNASAATRLFPTNNVFEILSGVNAGTETRLVSGSDNPLLATDNPYLGNRGNYDTVSLYHTVSFAAAGTRTPVTGNGASDLFSSGHEQSAFIIHDASGGTWTATTGFGAATNLRRVGNKDKDDYGLNQYFVPDTPQTKSDPVDYVPYDMWRNRRIDQDVVGAAIADPPIDTPPGPRFMDARGVREVRAVRRVR